jgi:hypothetical protein
MNPTLRNALIVLAAALGLYALFGFLVAPRLVRSAVEQQLAQAVTTRPGIGRVRVNPFKLSLTIEDFALPDARGERALAFRRLHLRFSLLSPFHRAWTLAELDIDEPAIGLAILEDRTLNLPGILRPLAPAKGPPADPPPLLIRRLQLRDGSLSYEDLSRRPEYRKALIPIQIELRDFTTRREADNAYSLEARADDGETLSWKGTFQLRPFASEGTFRIGELTARTLEEFLEDTLPFVITAGAVDFGAGYRFDATRTPAEFELSAMSVDVRDLALADRASGEPVIAVRSIAAREGTLKPARAELDLGTVTAEGADVRVWMDSTGMTNLQRWAGGAPVDSGPAWTMRIPRVTLRATALDYQDRRLDPVARFGVRDGSMELRDFSTAPGAVVPMSVSCSLGTGGRATAEGTLAPGVPSLDLRLDARGFELRDLQPYVGAFARLELASGTADARGRLRFNAFGARGPLLRYEGGVTSSGFQAIDLKVQKDFLSWERLDVRGLLYDMAPGRVEVRSVVMTRPYVRFVIAPDLTSNVQALMVPPDSLPPAFRPQPGTPAESVATRIDSIRVMAGSMYFADLSLRPNFATGIQGLNGGVAGLSSERAGSGRIALDGNVDEYAPARIAGTLNPLNQRDTTDVEIGFQNIELTTFTPYSGKFMGYAIDKGKLDLDLRYVIEGRQLRGENRILIRQLTLGEKIDSPEATKLPVKFAIALLKDRNGDIDLDIPVSGSLDDPKFSVGRIIVKVLLSLIVKAVTSPFALFGAVFGGDGDQQTPAIEFAYGSAEIDSSQVPKLEALRQGLADKPALKLEIEDAPYAAQDSIALMERHFADLLRAAPRVSGTARTPSPALLAAAAAEAPAGFEPADYAERLTRAYSSKFGRPPAAEAPARRAPRGAPPDSSEVAVEARRLEQMATRLRASARLNPDEVPLLRRERSRRVQGWVLADSSIAPDRVFVVAARGSHRPDSLGVKVGLTLTAD